MANSAEFRDLIYKSSDPTAPINDNTKVDRLLGIKPNGEAVVVDIKGNNTVALKSDAPAIKVVKDSEWGSYTSDDNAVPSVKAVNRRIPSVPTVAYDYEWELYKNENTAVPSCLLLKQKLSEVSGGGESVELVTDYTLETGSDDKTYSCKAIHTMYELACQQPTGGGTPAGNETVWVAAGDVISPVSGHANKKLSIGSGGITTTGSITASQGNLSAKSASFTDAVSIDGDLSVSGKSSLGTIQTQESIYAKSIRIGGWWNDSPHFTMKTEGGNGIAAYCYINLSVHAPSFYQSSDASLKENVAPLSDSALSAAASVPLVEFDWKESGLHSYGTIAQECEKHMPELVSAGSDGKKSVDYIALLCAKVAALEKKVAELESKVQ